LNLNSIAEWHARWHRSKLRKAFAVMSLISAVLTVFAVGAWIWAGTARGQATLARLVVRSARDAVPGLRVARLGRAQVGDLIATGVDLMGADGARAVHVDRVYVRPSWRALLSRKLNVDEVRVEGVAVDAHVMPDGRLNLATLVEPAGGT